MHRRARYNYYALASQAPSSSLPIYTHANSTPPSTPPPLHPSSLPYTACSTSIPFCPGSTFLPKRQFRLGQKQLVNSCSQARSHCTAAAATKRTQVKHDTHTQTITQLNTHAHTWQLDQPVDSSAARTTAGNRDKLSSQVVWEPQQ